MAATLTAKQMRQLLQNISADPQLKQSQDSILLAEDQYPDALDAIFTRLTTPTTMQNTMNHEFTAMEPQDRKRGIRRRVKSLHHSEPGLLTHNISTDPHRN